MMEVEDTTKCVAEKALPEGFQPPRGFTVAVIGNRDETKYRCSHCKLILRNPVQSFCGHRYCRECIEHLTSSGDEVVCPSCVLEQAVSEESILDMNRIFPDNATKKELYRLPAVCPNEGCTWAGVLKEYEKHEQDCPFRVEHCICGGTFSPAEYAEHTAKHCPLRPVTCEFCSKNIQFKNTQAHLSICPKFPITCHRCLEEGIPREEMEAHLQRLECTPRIRCPYGCGALITEGDIDGHVHTSGRAHLDAVFGSLSTINQRLDQGLGSLKEEIEAMSMNVVPEGAVGGSDKRKEEKMEMGDNGDMAEPMQKDEVLESAIVVLQREIQKVQKKTEDLVQQRRTDADRIAVLERMVQGLNVSPSAAAVGLEELPHYDGSLLWRITGFTEKRQQALSNTLPGITSAPFYTSRTGYKMCGRVYLDGDGMGKGSHLSVFIVVMKGSYDSLLSWPFRQKVTMTLLDQGKKRRHVTDAFRPDPSSASFQQPRAEMNTASGCPMFVPLPEILQRNPGPDGPHFLKDDTIFIKLHVDTSTLSGL